MRTEDCSVLYTPQTVFQFNNGVSLRGQSNAGHRRGRCIAFDRTTVTRRRARTRFYVYFLFALPSESSQLRRRTTFPSGESAPPANFRGIVIAFYNPYLFLLPRTGKLFTAANERKEEETSEWSRRSSRCSLFDGTNGVCRSSLPRELVKQPVYIDSRRPSG